MEIIKQYLPYILIAIAGLFLLRMLRGRGPTILPQSQFTEQPAPDIYAAAREKGFELLAQTGIAQIGAERDVRLANIQRDIARGEQVNIANIARGEQINVFNLGLARIQNELRQLDILETLGLKSQETEIAKVRLQTELAKYLQSSQQQSTLQQLQLYLAQRDQDRQAQQSAINRYYSSRNTGNIIGSTIQALGRIFGQQQAGGNVYRTPPTFPTTSFTGGFDFGNIGF